MKSSTHLLMPIAMMAVSLALTGCVNPYFPSSLDAVWTPAGYSEAWVRPDCLEVGYVGFDTMTFAQARYLATCRAAELAGQQHKPWFEILVARQNTGKQVVHVPADYSSETSTDADGNTTTQWVEVSPAYDKTLNLPMSTLLIRLLDAPAPAALNAAEVMQKAKADGVVFGATRASILVE